ncbi:MAG: methyl-accepting chemotaxis protein [Pseudomonadota bacterium]
MSNVSLQARLIHGAAGLVVGGAGVGGVYLAGAEASVGVIVFYLALGAVVAIVPGLVVSSSLGRPLEILRDTIRATRNDGDLARYVKLPPGSPIEPVANAYNELLATFCSITTRIVFNSVQVTSMAEKLMTEAENTARGSQEQNAAAETAAEAVAEMAGGMNEVAGNAEESARIAQQAQEHSARGAQIVEDASAEIERIARSVEQSAQVVATLGERSEAISGIARTIREIADQTNLLALNAAIEAARAGEQGRGFAVVADEVRKLAERTSAATGEITEMITAIQSETQNAIGTIRDGSEQARSGAQLARQAAEALQLINQGAQETTQKIDLIARAAQTQAARSSEVAELVTNIMALADRNNEGASRTLEEARQLDYLATNLEEVGTIFKLGHCGDAALALHGRMPEVVRTAAAAVGRLFEEAVDRGELKLEDLFDRNYKPIPNTKPQKFNTRYDGFADRCLPAIQEPLLDRNAEITYAIACDGGGYVPTHNKRFCQPLTGDEQRDNAGNRTKRIFSDPVGKRCGTHEAPFLLQTYRRDTGEIMHDISAPIFVKGRHWGGFRIGYRTE